MRNRLYASIFLGLMVMIVCAFGFNFAHNPDWFGNSVKYGVLSGVFFFLGTVLDKRL